MKVALAQINPTVGDFSGNAAKILDAARRAAALGAELAVFPEMSIMGYPPRDLVEHAGFVAGGLEALDRLARELPLPAVVGFVARNETGEGKPLHNSAALIRDGRVVSVHHKSLLPTYDVFDEDRYFEPGRRPHVAPLGGRALGITICEDCWRIESSLRAQVSLRPGPGAPARRRAGHPQPLRLAVHARQAGGPAEAARRPGAAAQAADRVRQPGRRQRRTRLRRRQHGGERARRTRRAREAVRGRPARRGPRRAAGGDRDASGAAAPRRRSARWRSARATTFTNAGSGRRCSG